MKGQSQERDILYYIFTCTKKGATYLDDSFSFQESKEITQARRCFSSRQSLLVFWATQLH
jgi:hypothetical protein